MKELELGGHIRKLKSAVKAWLSSQPPCVFEYALRILRRPDAGEVGLMRQLISPGDTVLDIGANTGQFTCLFSRLAGSTGEVHAFEPMPASFKTLESNIQKRKLPSKVVLNQCALSDKGGMADIYVPGDDYTQASLAVHSVSSWEEDSAIRSDQVQVTTVDEYLIKTGIRTVDFVKCDTEGGELLVLKGARSMLGQEEPPFILLEIYESWTKDFGYSPKDLLNFLSSEGGYEFIYLGHNGFEYVPRSIEVIPGSFPDYLNFLCYVPQVYNEKIKRLLQQNKNVENFRTIKSYHNKKMRSLK